jgi:hypothetical protein
MVPSFHYQVASSGSDPQLDNEQRFIVQLYRCECMVVHSSCFSIHSYAGIPIEIANLDSLVIKK